MKPLTLATVVREVEMSAGLYAGNDELRAWVLANFDELAKLFGVIPDGVARERIENEPEVGKALLANVRQTRDRRRNHNDTVREHAVEDFKVPKLGEEFDVGELRDFLEAIGGRCEYLLFDFPNDTGRLAVNAKALRKLLAAVDPVSVTFTEEDFGFNLVVRWGTRGVMRFRAFCFWKRVGKKTERFEFEKPGDLIHCDYEVFAVPSRDMATAI